MRRNLHEVIDLALWLPRAERAPLLERLRESIERLDVPGGILVEPHHLVEHADTLELLALSRVPKIASLCGLVALRRLEVLALDGARQVTTLDDVAPTPALRLLDISDQHGIQTLAPLAGHPTLEFVLFQKTGDMSLAALTGLARLRAVVGYQSGAWDRDLSELPSLHSFDDHDAVKRDYFALRLRY